MGLRFRSARGERRSGPLGKLIARRVVAYVQPASWVFALTRREGAVSIAGSLALQACNDQQCLAPAKLPLEASLVISTGGSPSPAKDGAIPSEVAFCCQ
jgi:hypothetical protein